MKTLNDLSLKLCFYAIPYPFDDSIKRGTALVRTNLVNPKRKSARLSILRLPSHWLALRNICKPIPIFWVLQQHFFCRPSFPWIRSGIFRK